MVAHSFQVGLSMSRCVTVAALLPLLSLLLVVVSIIVALIKEAEVVVVMSLVAVVVDAKQLSVAAAL